MQWDENTRQKALSIFNDLTPILSKEQALMTGLVAGYFTHRLTSLVNAMIHEIKTSGAPAAKWLEQHDPTKTGEAIPEAIGLFVRTLVNPEKTGRDIKASNVRMSVKQTTDVIANVRKRIKDQKESRAAARAQRVDYFRSVALTFPREKLDPSSIAIVSTDVAIQLKLAKKGLMLVGE
jgi:hypothetical protein